MATALAVAFVVFSCKGNLSEAEKLDLSQTPIQVVDSMYFVQTENGKLKMRVEAPVMEVYDHDSLSYELFPKGLSVYGYTEEGSLETTIRSQKARHDMRKDGEDKWSAFGNVVIRNIPEGQGNLDGLLHQDVLPGRFHAGIRDAVRRHGPQCGHPASFQQLRRRGAGYYPGRAGFGQFHRAFSPSQKGKIGG